MINLYPRYGLWLALIIGLYLLLVGWMAIRLPAFASPNEALHYEVVALLHQTGWLPDPAASTRADERHQPPLYYLAVGAAALPLSGPTLVDSQLAGNPHFGSTHVGNLNPKIHAGWQNVPLLYVGRMVSALFGVIGILGMSLASRPFGAPAIRLLAVALFAFHPMVLFLGASLSNDLAVAAMSALLLGYSTTIITQPRDWRAFALWGLLLAAAVLTKGSAMILVLVLPFICLAQWQRQRSLAALLQSLLAAACAFGLCWGIWIVYNLQRGLDPLGTERSVPLVQFLTLHLSDAPLLLPHLFYFWRALTLDWSVGGIGFGPPAYYWFVAIFFIAGLFGWALVKPSATDRLLAAMHVVWIVPVIALYLTLNLLILRNFGITVPEGRHLLIILPSLAWLVVGGWRGWWPALWRNRMAWCMVALWTAIAIWLVVVYLPRLYPRMVETAVLASDVASPSQWRYGEILALDDLQLPERLTIGEMTPVDLEWEALVTPPSDYTISLQLIEPTNPQWVKVESQNSYPGLGMNPTSDWAVGLHYRDRFYLRPLAELNGPTRMNVVVWVLDKAAKGHALTVTQAGQVQDPPVVRSVVVAPATPLVVPPNAKITPVEFGNQIALIGLESSVDQDGQLNLFPFWQAKDAIAEDYSIFVHWLDAEGNIVAQSDGMPNQGVSPTSIWQKGDVIRDRYRPEGATGAVKAVRLGVYRLATSERLSTYQAGNHLPDDAITFQLEDLATNHE